MTTIDIDKTGSATSPLNIERRVTVVAGIDLPRAGDVVVVKALTESVTYGNLELPSGRLARINRGDVLLGVLGKRRALKGFVGDVPATLSAGDRLHLLNMGGVIGECKGHHSSLSDAIEVEVIGAASDENGSPLNIADVGLDLAATLMPSAPIVVVAGSCMNSGKTVAAVEIIKQASNGGLKVAGAKLTGIACLRDTLNMQDHGAFVTASFLDCGLPSTVDNDQLPSVARGVFNHLNSFHPDLIVAELGDGIVGGYGVDSILNDQEFRDAVSSFVFCASDYVGVIGGVTVLNEMGIKVDVVAGSVTDSKMGEDFVRDQFGLDAGNARRDGERLFSLIEKSLQREARLAA
ncbi:MAG TPA: hypothetical protein VJV05_07080 [Pyrinomonadaceae bacterium]|nr:hypothetical protein [Pyrinomonadaceae bacterium]